ncbi:hypothetical protein C8R45DRAFT_1000740 [Mycena sanguinolenta]|nr:hypothetical protein C8R45DRAFT_1000740 [Mycena sanguinolenta]
MVYTLPSIASRWRALQGLVDGTDLPVDKLRIWPRTIAPIIVERLEHNNRVFVGSPRWRHHIHLMIHPNPVRHDAYKLMVYASVTNRSLTDVFRRNFRGESPAPGTVLFTYALNLGASANSGDFWTRVSACSIVSDEIYSRLSYAGYAAITGSGDAVKIVDPRLTQRSLIKWARQTIREVMVISKERASASLSSTGVLLISNQDGIEVSYYA